VTGIKLDRVALDDVGYNPQRIADAIHVQLGDVSGPVPVHSVARALDITEIREERLTGFEGALLTTPERGYGSILVNAQSSLQRRRFTVGHELGHFLNPLHKPTAPDGFLCSRDDMIVSSDRNRHLRQEAEANAFAIELLTPRRRLARYLAPSSDLQRALDIASEFDISKEAAIRRYVALHDEKLAVVFSRDGRARYLTRGPAFPRLSLCEGDHMPSLPQPHASGALSLVEEAEPEEWLAAPRDVALHVQAFYQQEGYGMSLLIADTSDPQEAADFEDTFDRLTALGR
jgi:hypothetical protein